jgi:hypothetical protein
MANCHYAARIFSMANFPYDSCKRAGLIYKGPGDVDSVLPQYIFPAKTWAFPVGGSTGPTAEIKVQIGGAWKDAGSLDVEGWS